MLSETCKNAIVDLFNGQEVTVGTKKLVPISARHMEFTPAANESADDVPARIVVDFPLTVKRNGFLSEMLDFNNDTGVATFGEEQRSEVDISISTKEVRKGKSVINANTIAQAMLNKVNSIVRKEMPFVIKNYHAGMDDKRGISFRDNSKFVAADKRAEVGMRFYLKHEATWDYTTEEVTTFGPPSYQINFRLEDETDYTHVLMPAGE